MLEEIIFEVGGRHRNHLGWYEILNIKGNILEVRYESDGKNDNWM
jgi:hypothetical protein